MTVPTFEADHGQCFWCRKTFAAGLTRDHLTPRSAGGSDVASNIVPACKPCNLDRGRVADFAVRAADARAGRLHPADVEALRARAAEIDEVRDRWFDLEMERLGYSPTIELDASLPPPAELPAGPPAPESGPTPYRLRAARAAVGLVGPNDGGRP